MTWRIGDHGFVMTLASRVPNLIHQHLRSWIDRWLSDHKLAIPDVGSWAIHPGGPRILTTVAKSLQISEDHLQASRHVLTECGNMSSPTVLFILDHLQALNAPRPCVALGFGPGLTAEATLFN